MGLDTWTVYDHPADYPRHFVVRVFHSEAGAVTVGDAHLFDTLEQARLLIPPGLFRIPADPGDDPVIIETWI